MFLRCYTLFLKKTAEEQNEENNLQYIQKT